MCDVWKSERNVKSRSHGQRVPKDMGGGHEMRDQHFFSLTFNSVDILTNLVQLNTSKGKIC